MDENKFWLIFWSVVGTFIITITSIGIYSGYLDDQRDLTYASQGLQPYKVERCSDTMIYTEWHDANWQDTPKGHIQ